MKKISIITGHYGSGKTNISANMAIGLAKEHKKVTVVDLDIVNPYFRTADFKELFGRYNIELVSPMYANTNLDIPSISFDLERIAGDEGHLIVDVGGDDDGAVALGRYAEAFSRFSEDIDFYYTVNMYRYPNGEFYEAKELLYDIEKASRMKASAIINNSNIGTETTREDILASFDFAEDLSSELSLPVAFTTAPEFCRSKELDGRVKYVNIYVKPIWQ